MSKKSSYAWVIFVALCLLNFGANGIIFATLSMFLPQILAAHPEISTAALAGSSTVQVVVMIIMLMFVGKIQEKIGCKKMVIIRTVCVAGMYGSLTLAESLPLIYLGYAFNGLVSGFLMLVITPILINTWFAKRIGSMMGIATAMSGIGGIVMSPIVSRWIASAGYQNAFLFTGITI